VDDAGEVGLGEGDAVGEGEGGVHEGIIDGRGELGIRNWGLKAASRGSPWEGSML
jgi:hypothetical protein